MRLTLRRSFLTARVGALAVALATLMTLTPPFSPPTLVAACPPEEVSSDFGPVFLVDGCPPGAAFLAQLSRPPAKAPGRTAPARPPLLPQAASPLRRRTRAVSSSRAARTSAWASD